MAITVVAWTSAAPGVNGGSTAAIDTTGANLLVISRSSYDLASAPPTISDSKSNTWTALTERDGGDSNYRLYYCLAPTVGSGHTVTAVSTGCRVVIFFYAFTGVASYQTQSGAVSATGTIASLACGSVTPSANGALIVTGVCGRTAVTDAVTPSGFTLASHGFVSGANMQGSAAWQVQATAGAINPTWGFTPNQTHTAVGAAVFLATVTGAAHADLFVWGPI